MRAVSMMRDCSRCRAQVACYQPAQGGAVCGACLASEMALGQVDHLTYLPRLERRVMSALGRWVTPA